MPDECRQWHATLDVMEGAGFSGAVLLEHDGETVFLRCCGLADRQASVPVSTSTVFDIGSVTKTFTATAILKLAATGALSVEQRLAELLPEVPSGKAEITIHQLLTHSAGLADFLAAGGERLEEYAPDLDYEQVSRDELLERIWRFRLLGPPGGVWSYSNTGYSLLAAIIEQVSGLSYESFLRGEVLQPLGMLHTGYYLPDWSDVCLAQGYIGERSWGRTIDKPRSADSHYWMVRGNGGLLSNLEDLRRWQGVLHGKLFSESLVEHMLVPHVLISRENNIWQGYGWAIQQNGGEHMVYHNGSNEIFSATYRWFPKSHRLLVVLSNQADFPAFAIPRRLAADGSG